MPRFAANLTMMFNEHSFLERFEAAASAGFRGVEFLFPYDHPPETVAGALRAARLEQVLFNMPPGDWSAGERGLAAVPGRESEFESGVEKALEYARATGCPRLHMMAGVVPEDASRNECEAVYVRNLRHAAAGAARLEKTVLIEPINTRDIPGYFLNTQGEARRLLAEAGAPNTALQMDFYHCQIVEGDLATKLRGQFCLLGHIQIAGVPERNEPDAGEVNYPYLFRLLDELAYTGWVGCEYRPRRGTVEGLGWARPYGIGTG